MLIPFKVFTLGCHTVLPIAISCCVIFSWISSSMAWNLFPYKGDFSFGKIQKLQGTKSGLQGGLSHLGNLMFHQKNSAWDMMHEQEHCCSEAANHQLPIAAAFWIIQNSFCREMSKLNPKFDSVHCSTLSVTLNATATQYMCLLNSTYRPHWLAQWSRHCSHMCIPVHSPWLPGYVDGAQTILYIKNGWTFSV